MSRHRATAQRRTLLDRILRRRKPIRIADQFVRVEPGAEWQTPDEWARQHSGPAVTE